MLAEYKGYVYIANVKDEQVTLLTYNQSKMLEGFEPKRDYFKKVVDINDSCVCIFRKNCASVPEERSAIPLQTEQSSAG